MDVYSVLRMRGEPGIVRPCYAARLRKRTLSGASILPHSRYQTCRDQPIADTPGVFVITLKPRAQRLLLDRDADAEEANQDESEYDAPP